MSDGDPIALCLAGQIAPNVALARLILAGGDADDIARKLRDLTGTAAEAMRGLLLSRWGAIAHLSRVAREVDHTVRGEEALASLRDGFDHAARLASEVSVAFYTLGDPELMAVATAEIVEWLAANHLLGTTRDVLDLGCGIGRVAAALAPHVRSVLGIDIAPEMIDQARKRYAPDSRLRFQLTDGARLSSSSLGLIRRSGAQVGGRLKPAHDALFDLLLAVDSFPYLIQAGVAAAHIADAARIIRPGGAVVILNLSYCGLDHDRDQARRWAARFGFRLSCDGAQPFTLWDGRAFVLRRRERQVNPEHLHEIAAERQEAS